MLDYLKNYKGEARSSSTRLPAGETKTLPDQECKFVMLHNWNVTDDENFSGFAIGIADKDAGNEIYYGFDGNIAAQLFVGESTALLPISNLNQITVRRPSHGNADNPQIYFTWFN